MTAASAFSPAQAVIAAMITPALLILASASLIATALVRLARVVDRVRKLAELRAAGIAVSAEEIERHARRARYALVAIVALFSAVAVVVIGGAGIAIDRATGGAAPWLPLGATVAGMALIVIGAAAMVLESIDASRQISAEIAALRRPNGA